LKAEDFIPVGTGQYKVDNYDSYKDLLLSPNSSYFGTVARNKVLVQIVPDKNNLANLIENDTVTCYVDKGSDRKTMVTDNDLKMFDMISNEVDFVYFNNSGVFKDANLRKAVAYAIDSENVLEKGYMNDGVLTDTIYYPNYTLNLEQNQIRITSAKEKAGVFFTPAFTEIVLFSIVCKYLFTLIYLLSC
jgi:peptide/nickel transport system substrate-binding protein